MVFFLYERRAILLNERIKKLRKFLDLTQAEFGRRIGMKQNTIALIEGGRNTSDQTIFLICREFNVREEWLRTGEGEMFAPAVTDELEALAERYPTLTHESLVFIEKLVGLSEANQNIIMGFLREVVEGFGDVAPGTQAKPGVMPKMSEEELHAELDRQIAEEKTAAAKSEVS